MAGYAAEAANTDLIPRNAVTTTWQISRAVFATAMTPRMKAGIFGRNLMKVRMLLFFLGEDKRKEKREGQGKKVEKSVHTGYTSWLNVCP